MREGFSRTGGRASGGAGQDWGLPGRGLVKVVREVLLGKVFRVEASEIEFYLGRSTGGMKQRG